MYGEDDYYVKLAEEKLFIPSGVLNIGRADSEFIRNVIGSAEKYSLPVDVLTAAEVNVRWAGLGNT